VPFAIRYPTSTQLKTLVYECIGSILLANFLILVNMRRLMIFGCSVLYGLSMSAIYPLMMSMASYLKLRLSAKNTLNYVVSGAMGESIIPILLGYSIGLISPNILFVASLVYARVLLLLYHQMMKFELSTR
jgi:hypothetical protein